MSARAVVRGTHADGTVDVEIDTSERCAGCAGVCLWRRLPDTQRIRLAARTPIAPGTAVRVALPARYVALGSLLLHGLPLAALLAGALVGAYVGSGDLGAVAGAVAAGAFVLGIGPRLRPRFERALAGALRLERRS